MPIRPTSVEHVHDVDGVLSGAGASFVVIRGQCHRIVRVANQPQELIAALTLIEREVIRLAGCITHARELLSGNRQAVRSEPADPHQMVSHAVDRFDAAAAERGVELRAGPTGAGWLVADGESMRLALDRVLATAIADVPGGECLTVSVCASGPRSGRHSTPALPDDERLPGAA